MRYQYILIIVLAALLTACVKQPRVAFNWEQYAQSDIKDSMVIPADFDNIWSVLKETGNELGFNLIAEDKLSGVLTYTKPDTRWQDSAFELTVIALKRSEQETEVHVRGFVFQVVKKPHHTPTVFPSTGDIEREFLEAVKARINGNALQHRRSS